MSVSVPPRTTPDTPPPLPPSTVRNRGTGLYRAFWRWHFFAGLLVAPVLLVLATTGLIYLFRFQLEPLMHADLMKVHAAPNTVLQPYSTQQALVEEAHPGARVVSMTEPRDAGRSTVFSITTADGQAREVYVDPYRPAVLGSLDPDATVSGTAVRLHRDLMAGRFGDTVIEIAACWALVLAITGYYLLVKGRRARTRSKGRPGARLRAWHAWLGAVAGVGLLMLIVSGLPWTGVWGAKVQEVATRQGTSLWSNDPGALSNPTSTLDESLPHSHDVPWAQGDSAVPQSQPPAHGTAAAGEANVANLDTAVTVADRQGLRHPFTIALPAQDRGVYSVIGYAFDAPSDERTVHVDRFGGEVVSTYGFDDYPLLAKVVAQGIGLHEGRSLGLWSFWGSALMCAVIIAACVTGPLMWWRRRPRGTGRLVAPRGRMPLLRSPGLVLAVAVLGVVLPMFGISLVVVLLVDQLVLRRVPRWGTYLDVS